VEWDALHPAVSLSALSSSLLDHAPLLMSTYVGVPCKRRFRFESFWVKLARFQEAIVGSWACTTSVPSDTL
jgi:hypothetical protein